MINLHAITNSLIMKASRYISALFLLTMILAGAAQSQTTTTSNTDGMTPSGMRGGAPAGSYALSGFDNINLFNGNLNFRLPLLEIGGRGSARMTIMEALNVKSWHVQHVHRVFPDGNETDTYKPTQTGPIQSYSGYGAGVLRGRRMGLQTSTIYSGARYYSKTLSRLTFFMADGTEYEMRDQSTGGQPLNSTYTQGASRGTVFVSADGSFATFISDTTIFDSPTFSANGPSPGFSPSGYLMMRDGTRYRIDGGNISWIRDRNGNVLTFTYATGTMTITDSLNRSVTVNYDVSDAAPYGLCDQIIYKGVDGLQRIIRVSKTTLENALRPNSGYTIKYPGGATGLFPELNNGSTTILYNPTVSSAVWLPDGRSYKFYYNSYGELARVELPTGGAIEYDMTAGSGVAYPCQTCTEGTEIYRRVVERRVYPDGSTGSTFESRIVYGNTDTVGTSSTIPSSTITVEQQDSNGVVLSRSRHYFDGSALSSLFGPDDFPAANAYSAWYEGHERQTEALDTAGTLNNATVLRRVFQTWAQRAPVSWWSAYAATEHLYSYKEPSNDPRVIETVTTIEPGGANLVTKTTSKDPSDSTGQTVGFDQYNNPTDLWEYDFGTGQSGGRKRHTHTDYLTTNNSIAYDTVNPSNTSPNVSATVHLRGLPVQQSVFDGNDIEQSRTTYEYDNYTGTNHAALVNHTDISGLCTYYTLPNSTPPNQCTNTSPVDGVSTAATYPTRGNVTAITRYLLSNGTVTSSISSYLQYDIAGNVVKSIDGRGKQTTISYSDNFGSPDNEATTNSASTQLSGQMSYAFPTIATNALAQSAYTQYNYYLGKPVNTEDVNHVVNSFTYGSTTDPLDRASQIVRAVNNLAAKSRTTFTYDDTNHVVTTKSDLNIYDDPVPLKSQSLYDGLGRASESRQYETDTVYITTKQTYDALGRVWRTYNPYRTTSDATYGWSETTYDSLSRSTKVETFDGSNTSTGTVQIAYLGNTVTVTDQQGKVRKSVSDALGRLSSVIEDPATNPPTTRLNYQTDYEYDPLGNLIKVTQGNQIRSFVYDSLSRLIFARNPEQEATLPDTQSPIQYWSMSYAYDENGNLTQKKDARSVSTTIGYDDLNRIMSRTYSNNSNGTPSVAYYYDAQALPSGAPTDLDRGASTGHLVAVLYGGGSTGTYLGYDSIGQLKQSFQVTNDGQANRTYSMGYGYNLAGELTSQTYPSGKVITTEYDSAGRIAGVKKESGSSYYAGGGSSDTTNRLQYNASGAVTSMRLGNGLWEHTNFNSRLQPTEIGLGGTSLTSEVLKLGYSYGTTTGNNNGNVMSQTITVHGIASPLVQTYTYDTVNRLETAKENNGDSWKQKFSYDQYGNRTFDQTQTSLPSMNEINQSITNPTISAANNRFSNGQGYDYDEAGNLKSNPNTGIGSNAYTYDAQNRLVNYYIGNGSTLIASYSFDGDGHRVRKINNGSTTIFVYNAMGQMVAEYSSPSTTGGTKYLTLDNLGSPRVITDADGGVKGRHDSLPFGEEISASFGNRSLVADGHPSFSSYGVDDKLNQKFTTYERDAETNLDFAQARMYAYSYGRFTSPDEFFNGADTSDPQSWNLYVYVRNNPLVFVDPTGMLTDFIDQEGTRTHINDGRDQVLYAETSVVNQFQDQFVNNREGYYRNLDYLQGTRFNLHMTTSEFNNLAGVIYAESSNNATVGEAGGIFGVLNNRAGAAGNSVLDQATSSAGVYGADVKDRIFSKYASASKVKAVYLGIAQSIINGEDFSNGAYYWQGIDFHITTMKAYKLYYSTGFHFTDSAHDIWGMGDHGVNGVVGKGKNQKTYTYKFESTGAEGGTTFMRLTTEWKKANGYGGKY